MNFEPRKDPAAKPIEKEEFIVRFKKRFEDPIYDSHRNSIEEMSELAWQAHQDNHKAPLTKKAGPGFKDPNYEVSIHWLKAKEELRKAQALHDDPMGPTRILIISAADRNDQSCPGEVSKTKRLALLAAETLKTESDVEIELLDLSQMISEYGKHIYPCKACVSTAMPLCHWPCSCYPNFAVDQMHDWMNDIYPMWVRAHGILLLTPVYWYQAPSALKLMMDRLVCADGGNEDVTSTQGKDAKLAKEIEIKGWHYPRHLAGRIYSVLVHGDADGADSLRSALNNWLSDLHLNPANFEAAKARYIGYYDPYATSHEALDKDKAIQEEVRNSALSLLLSSKAARLGKLQSLNPHMEEPRAK